MVYKIEFFFSKLVTIEIGLVFNSFWVMTPAGHDPHAATLAQHRRLPLVGRDPIRGAATSVWVVTPTGPLAQQEPAPPPRGHDPKIGNPFPLQVKKGKRDNEPTGDGEAACVGYYPTHGVTTHRLGTLLPHKLKGKRDNEPAGNGEGARVGVVTPSVGGHDPRLGTSSSEKEKRTKNPPAVGRAGVWVVAPSVWGHDPQIRNLLR